MIRALRADALFRRADALCRAGRRHGEERRDRDGARAALPQRRRAAAAGGVRTLETAHRRRRARRHRIERGAAHLCAEHAGRGPSSAPPARPCPGYRLRVIDADGNETPADLEPGELVVQGESVARFYWNKPERTASAWTKDGWFRSGDTMYRDADGYFFFCGRGDDMLKVGGIWVAPFEIESALAAHPAVIEAAVIGAPDENDLIKPKGLLRAARSRDRPVRRWSGADRLHQAAARAVQVSALDRVHRRAAEDREREDPALPATWLDSCVGACPLRKTGAHFSGTCAVTVRDKTRALPDCR